LNDADLELMATVFEKQAASPNGGSEPNLYRFSSGQSHPNQK
jgi:hypothetical protein